MKYSFILLILTLFLSSCHKDEPMWFDNEYVFLEQHLIVYSEKISGMFDPSHVCVDFPTYFYNPQTKDFYGEIERNYDSATGNVTTNTITGETMILLGMGESHSGIASSGEGTSLYEVHSLPYNRYNLIVKSIEEDGTVHFNYKDSSMTLSPDEEWSVVWTKLDTFIDNFEDWDNIDNVTGYPYVIADTMIIKWTYLDRVTNWGLLEKDQFHNLEDMFK
ncbi:hypothetical protein [Draconibacterium sediminis]|uniref:hypothetical protein n=1 Tax=Draconibacterium sediminis TaxID=1544798 RepID=UPI0026F01477|nr:hypothetical protein [Draconibacterium sediminis]